MGRLRAQLPGDAAERIYLPVVPFLLLFLFSLLRDGASAVRSHTNTRGDREMPEAASPGPVVMAEGRVQTPLRPQRLCSLISFITSWPSLLWGPCGHSLTATLQTLRGCRSSPAPSQVPDLFPERFPALTAATPQALPTLFVLSLRARTLFPPPPLGKVPIHPSTPTRGLLACAGSRKRSLSRLRRMPAPARDPAFRHQ